MSRKPATPGSGVSRLVSLLAQTLDCFFAALRKSERYVPRRKDQSSDQPVHYSFSFRPVGAGRLRESGYFSNTSRSRRPCRVRRALRPSPATFSFAFARTSAAAFLRNDHDASHVAEQNVAVTHFHAGHSTGPSRCTILARPLVIERTDPAVEDRETHLADLLHVAHQAIGDATAAPRACAAWTASSPQGAIL